MTTAAKNAVSYLRQYSLAGHGGAVAAASRIIPRNRSLMLRGLRQRAAANAPQTGAWARFDDCRCMEMYPSPSRLSTDHAAWRQTAFSFVVLTDVAVAAFLPRGPAHTGFVCFGRGPQGQISSNRVGNWGRYSVLLQ